mmetsp:Transcript_73475/g.153294  ORF Transcript_73475/g.153294 Transcript_73475/m.153294 type:complete len:248 (-) Transcript_73475:979-1722(-)
MTSGSSLASEAALIAASRSGMDSLSMAACSRLATASCISLYLRSSFRKRSFAGLHSRSSSFAALAWLRAFSRASRPLIMMAAARASLAASLRFSSTSKAFAVSMRAASTSLSSAFAMAASRRRQLKGGVLASLSPLSPARRRSMVLRHALNFVRAVATRSSSMPASSAAFTAAPSSSTEAMSISMASLRRWLAVSYATKRSKSSCAGAIADSETPASFASTMAVIRISKSKVFALSMADSRVSMAAT